MTIKPSKMQTRVNATPEHRQFLDALKDAEVPVNTFWDEATNLYMISMKGLRDSHGVLADFIGETLSTPEGRASIKDHAGLKDNIELLTRDVATHVQLLNDIYADHKDMSGGSQSPDEHMAVISINGRYHDVIEMYNTKTMPTIAHIFEQIGITDAAIAHTAATAQSQAEADVINPDVITDIAVKEVTHD